MDSAAAEDSSVGNINQKLTPFYLQLLPISEKMTEAEPSQDWTAMAAVVSLSTYYLRFMHDAAGPAQ